MIHDNGDSEAPVLSQHPQKLADPSPSRFIYVDKPKSLMGPSKNSAFITRLWAQLLGDQSREMQVPDLLGHHRDDRGPLSAR